MGLFYKSARDSLAPSTCQNISNPNFVYTLGVSFILQGKIYSFGKCINNFIENINL